MPILSQQIPYSPSHLLIPKQISLDSTLLKKDAIPRDGYPQP